MPGEPGYAELADSDPGVSGLSESSRKRLASGHLSELAGYEG